MLVLLPFSMGAQEVDQSVEKRIDSLATEVTTLDKVVQKAKQIQGFRLYPRTIPIWTGGRYLESGR